jgi:acetyl esterase/lipase
MIYKKIFLFPDREDVYLEAFVADPLPHYTRKAILVIPGGGYGEVCANREGEPIALAFLPYGYNAFVLHYSVARRRVFPEQLIESSAAMKHIRDNAEAYGIDPEKVFVTGFSAGGHLTAMLGTLWHRKEVYEALDMPYGYNKPTGIMPIYPVISADPAHSHGGSFRNLRGTDEPTQEQLDEVSLEKQVDERSAPCFLVHTADDTVVPVMNSLLFAQAYAACGRTFELHIYPSAPHGMALGNDITALGYAPWSGKNLEKWVEQAALWAELLG